MDRKPRAADEAVLPKPLLAWLAVVGLVMGVVTLATISWATDPHGLATARTVGFTAFALSHVFFAITTKDETRSIFNLDIFDDKPLLIASGLAILVIILSTSLNPLQRLLQTTDLKLELWLVAVGAALVVPVISELRKWLVHRPLEGTPGPPVELQPPTSDLTVPS
jgi:Ca2+-transporting ATPase